MALTRRFVFSLLLLSGAACGLTGSEDPLRPVPSDGVGNFGPSAPIELCLGTARVTPPKAGSFAGSLCVKEGRKGAPCSEDTSCSGIERCICGRCIVEACQGAVSCGTGKVCRRQRCTSSCSVDGDCSPDERCVLGGCARSCQSDEVCHFGERCDDLQGVCSTKLCNATMSCGAGDACEAEQSVGELHEPELLSTGEGDLAFVELRTFGQSPRRAIYRARVDTSARWTADPEQPVLPAEAGDHTGAPSLLERDGHLELFFTSGNGAAIVRALSTDGGRSFVPDSVPLLVPSKPWEQGWVGSPSVVVFQGRTLLFYEGGPRAGIGLAVVEASVAERLVPTPIVNPGSVEDPLFWWSVTEVGAPHALVVGDTLRVYFTARGSEGGDAIVADASLPAERNDSIGLVASRDAKVFTPSPTGPVFARIANLRAHLGEREAVVRVLPDGAEIVFVGSDASGDSVSGLARAGR